MSSKSVRGISVSGILTGSAASSRDPGEVAHPAGDALVAAVGEEELGLAEGAEAGRLDLLDPGAGQRAAADLGQVEHSPIGDPLAEVGEGARHLGAGLVAAGPDS